MKFTAKFALLFVVFVDLLGQGLVFPILNSLIMETDSGFLPKDTTDAVRHMNFGLVIGIFFLSWFFGVMYLSKLSDAIGRKNALLICLSGALIGYVITIVALMTSNLWLLVFGRAITGFTAGNQPIAQAAMIDGSTDAAERDRNMGYIITGVSFGLVLGPVIGAVLSDKTLFGNFATLETPFYGALVLVAIAMLLVIFNFKDIRKERIPYKFHPSDIVTDIWEITRHSTVMRLMPAYCFFMLSNVTFYVFIDNYLTSAFGYGVVGGSAAMLVIGFALAFSSTFLVKPVQKRVDKRTIIATTVFVWIFASLAVAFSPYAILCFVPIFLFYLFFGVAFPTILGLFSGSVGDADQGWIMGITTAVFTLAGGIMSLIGGSMMSFDIRFPYFFAATMAALALVAIMRGWKNPDIRRLTQKT
jgi:predicted MFS family arabinose efflux permease